MTTTKDLLSIPSLANMKLIAGASGLSRPVLWPYVILCPPIAEWVSGGEFLIYYGANSIVEKVELKQLVKEAADNNAAGILFLVGHHYILEENLDDELKALADKLNMPVFSYTSLAYVNSITKDIIQLIQKRSAKDMISSDFWYSLFFDNADTEQLSTLNKALLAGYLPNYTYCVYIVQLMNSSEYLMERERLQGSDFAGASSEFFRMLASKLNYSIRRIYGDSFWHIAKNDFSIFVFPCNTKKQETKTDKLISDMCCYLEAQYPKTTFCAGKGSCQTQLSGIRLSYLQARRSLLAYRLINNKKHIITYAELGFYQLLFEIPTADTLKEYESSILKELILYDEENGSDLYGTLLAYFDCCCNQVQTAKQLFLHRNTLINRLEKISCLTGLSLSDSDSLYCLQTAVRVHRFLSET